MKKKGAPERRSSPAKFPPEKGRPSAGWAECRGDWVGELGEEAKTKVEVETQLNISQQGVW